MSQGRVPAALLALAGLGLLFFLLPLAGLIVRAPWDQAIGAIGSPETGTALGLSLFCSLTATAVALVLGIPLAFVLSKTTGNLRSVIRALTTLPMVLPPVVGGVALLLAFGRKGLVGSILRSLDPRYEEAARALGARGWMVFARVTLPLLRPAIFSGAVLCWARALGEFGATITFAGNFPGRTQTVPVAVYVALETRPESAIVLSLILLAVSLAVLVGMRDRWLGAL